MATLVPVTRTNITLEALVEALVHVWFDLFGDLPEAIDVAVVFGKLIAENGWPDAPGGRPQSTYGWNLGNLRGEAPDDLGGAYHLLRGAWELANAAAVPGLLRAGYVVLDPPPPQAKITAGMVCVLPPLGAQKFRAYPDLRAGLTDYLRTLPKFRKAWDELRGILTDPVRFVLALYADHYFTGNVDAYRRNVVAGTTWALPKVEALLAAMPRPSSDGPPTQGQTPTSRSSSSQLRAVDAPIVEVPPTATWDGPAIFGPATPLRAGEGEHELRLEPVDLDAPLG